MMLVDERVAEFVVVVAKVDDGVGLTVSVRNPEARGERAADAVADDHLERDNFDLAAELFALAYALDEVGLDAVAVEITEQDRRDLAVQGTFSFETRPFDAVVGQSHILVSENDFIGIVGRKDLLLLAIENQFVFLHCIYLCLK